MTKIIGSTHAVEFYNVSDVTNVDDTVAELLKGATRKGEGYFVFKNSYLVVKHYPDIHYIMVDLYIDKHDNYDLNTIVERLCVVFNCTHSLTATFSRELMTEEELKSIATSVQDIPDSEELQYVGNEPKYLN